MIEINWSHLGKSWKVCSPNNKYYTCTCTKYGMGLSLTDFAVVLPHMACLGAHVLHDCDYVEACNMEKEDARTLYMGVLPTYHEYQSASLVLVMSMRRPVDV